MKPLNCKSKYDPLLDQGGADRINSVSKFLKDTFGKKMIKLSLDCGFTCPNRDGTLGTGGCTFCSDMTSGGSARPAESEASLSHSIDEQIRMYKSKWPNAGYIAYFQSHTNTYGDVSLLKKYYYAALSDPRIEGIAIATRPDCLPGDVLDLLSEIGREHFLWVELGLQTSNDETAERINRCYTTSVYDSAIAELNNRGIKVVTHIILGLPGETKEDMMRSVKHAVNCGTWGIKLHMLNVVKGSRLAKELSDYVSFDSIEEYVSLVCDILEIIPENIVIHRLTADSPRPLLISPEWSYKKRSILNSIHATLRKRGTRQGSSVNKDR